MEDSDEEGGKIGLSTLLRQVRHGSVSKTDAFQRMASMRKQGQQKVTQPRQSSSPRSYISSNESTVTVPLDGGLSTSETWKNFQRQLEVSTEESQNLPFRQQHHRHSIGSGPTMTRTELINQLLEGKRKGEARKRARSLAPQNSSYEGDMSPVRVQVPELEEDVEMLESPPSPPAGGVRPGPLERMLLQSVPPPSADSTVTYSYNYSPPSTKERSSSGALGFINGQSWQNGHAQHPPDTGETSPDNHTHRDQWQPSLPPVPQDPPSPSTALYHRSTAWRAKSDLEVGALREAGKGREMDGCTFAPKTLRKSGQIVAARRRRTGGESPNPGDRMYAQAQQQRARHNAAVKAAAAEEDAVIERQCTFAPRTLRQSPTRSSRSNGPSIPVAQMRRRPWSAPSGGRRDMPRAAPKRKVPFDDCTFAPQINGVPRHMASARQYLRVSVEERLHKPPPSAVVMGAPAWGGAALAGPQKVMDVDSFLTRAEAVAIWRESKDSQQEVANVTAPSIQHQQQRGELQKSFAQFLAGQCTFEARRQRKLERLASAAAPTFTPQIDPKSKHMVAEKHGRVGFLDRVNMDAARKDRASRVAAHAAALDSEKTCPFKPTVTAAAAQKRGRTAAELSDGDVVRRNHAHDLAAQRVAASYETTHSFHPALATAASALAQALAPRNAKGKVGASTAADLVTYLERVQRKSAARDAHARRIWHEKALREASACTFVPEVIDCPGYVKRTAESMRAVRLARQQQQKEQEVQTTFQQPEWR